MDPRYGVDQTEHGAAHLPPLAPRLLRRPVGDVDVRLVRFAALFAQRNLTGSAFALPRDLGIMILELVEEDVEAGTLELFLELVVRLFDIAVEVALDHIRRALRGLLRVCELVRLDLREARRQLWRLAEGAPRASGLRLLAEVAFLALLVAPTAAAGNHQT